MIIGLNVKTKTIFTSNHNRKSSRSRLRQRFSRLATEKQKSDQLGLIEIQNFRTSKTTIKEIKNTSNRLAETYLQSTNMIKY